MTKQELTASIRKKNSFLCVGLDTNPDQIPEHLRGKPNAVVTFNKAIINATLDQCVAYKINTAFYEAYGTEGWKWMEETLQSIPSSHLRIADAKRGDIGNSSGRYAKAFFETFGFDAITVAPYMGEDSVRPFLEYNNKWTIVLGLTSNTGAEDFELLKLKFGGQYLYQKVLEEVSKWGTTDNLMFVTGATQSEYFSEIRKIVPDHFLLIPGVGFQGGNLSDVAREGMNNDVGLLVNASRAIIYAGENENFDQESRIIASQYAAEMKELIAGYSNK